MKTRVVANILLIVFMLLGCAEAETSSATNSATEVRPGVYMGNDPAEFKFPTSGYTVYIVGETHGNNEAKLVFQSFLENLYQDAGLRDVILEEDQAYETEANAYIHGLTDELPKGLCLKADILGIIRDFNSGRSDNEKVNVHLVDVDSPLPTIYQHLLEIHQQLGSAGESISFPDFSEFREWLQKDMYSLIDEIRKASHDQTDIINGLDTVSLSIEWYFLGNRLDTGMARGIRYTFGPIREDVITKNIRYLLDQLDGKPVLAYFGSWHGMKTQGDSNPSDSDFKSWAQRLIESDISVYSVAVTGFAGKGYWRGEVLEYDDEIYMYQFEDKTAINSLFDTHPDYGILYANLNVGDNPKITITPEFWDVPISQIYDDLIIFKKFTPMENVCPK